MGLIFLALREFLTIACKFLILIPVCLICFRSKEHPLNLHEESGKGVGPLDPSRVQLFDLVRIITLSPVMCVHSGNKCTSEVCYLIILPGMEKVLVFY